MVDLEASDYRSIIRVVGEAALGYELNEKKRSLMVGICELVDADAWLWTQGKLSNVEDRHAYVGYLKEGFDEERFVHFLNAVEHPDSNIAASRFYEQAQSSMVQTTIDHEELDPEGLACRGELGALWKLVEIGAAMLNGLYLDKESISVIGVFRYKGGEAFNEREKAIVNTTLAALDGLQRVGWPGEKAEQIPRLSPQQRKVMNLLLEGFTKKEVAEQMGLQNSTVSTYTREVYRRFSV
ncbi:MAG: helix-turn-helix transcriptional regulator, partial [Verrucomicrobiota bacterium]